MLKDSLLSLPRHHNLKHLLLPLFPFPSLFFLIFCLSICLFLLSLFHFLALFLVFFSIFRTRTFRSTLKMVKKLFQNKRNHAINSSFSYMHLLYLSYILVFMMVLSLNGGKQLKNFRISSSIVEEYIKYFTRRKVSTYEILPILSSV